MWQASLSNNYYLVHVHNPGKTCGILHQKNKLTDRLISQLLTDNLPTISHLKPTLTDGLIKNVPSSERICLSVLIHANNL